MIALKDPAILMKHIAAVADILYLEAYSEEQTRELLGTVFNYYRSIDKMIRKQWEPYTNFFARFSNSIRIIKQCAILLNDNSHIMSEEHTIKTLFDCLKPDPKHHEIHSYCMNIRTEVNKKQSTLIDQITTLKRHIGNSDNIIKSEHNNHKDKEKKNREKGFNSRRHVHDPNSHQAGNNMVQTDESSIYFSVQDLLNAEIDPSIIERLSKTSKTKAGQSAGNAQPPPSTSGKSAILPPTNTFPNLAPTRGGYAPRGGRGRGGHSYNPTARHVQQNSTGSFINSNTNFSHDNDFEDSGNGGLFTDENVNCSCISTCLHQQDTNNKKRKNTEIIEVNYTILHHDDGNSSHHCVNTKKNLTNISEPRSDFISTMSGISPEWTTKHQLVGIHPLLGLVAYNPEYRVSFINPNILINDG